MGEPDISCGSRKGGFQACSGYTFLEVNPETGRTHQIRIHMEYLGKPIVGDSKYGSKEKLPKGRIFLHAGKLVLKLPNLTEVEFQAQLPPELEEVLEQARKGQNT